MEEGGTSDWRDVNIYLGRIKKNCLYEKSRPTKNVEADIGRWCKRNVQKEAGEESVKWSRFLE